MTSRIGTADTTGARAAQIVMWSLRICGGVDLLATAAFFMPTSWMRLGHELCGMGPFPDGPVPVYLARATSLLWAMHGALLLYLSSDVRRYAEFVRFVARVTVVAGGLLLWLALTTGLPLWWAFLEGPVFAATGLWYLWWLRHLK